METIISSEIINGVANVNGVEEGCKAPRFTLKGYITAVAQQITRDDLFSRVLEYLSRNPSSSINRAIRVVVRGSLVHEFMKLRKGDKLIVIRAYNYFADEWIKVTSEAVSRKTRADGVQQVRFIFSEFHRQLLNDDEFLDELERVDNSHPWLRAIVTNERKESIKKAAKTAYDLFTGGVINEETANMMLAPLNLYIGAVVDMFEKEND